MYNGVHTHYPFVPYRHHGINVCSSYDIAEPLPVANVNVSVPAYPAYGYRRGISCIDYPYYDYLPPIVQTNVQNDYFYYYDDPGVVYDDDYGNAYRLSRSKVQLVDVAPRHNVRTFPKHTVVSTYRPREERIVVPRSKVIRYTSLPPYERRKVTRIAPLYHSAPTYVMTSRI
jgi:hypothetical protein